jgi:3-dehydroquinate dehydratase I
MKTLTVRNMILGQGIPKICVPLLGTDVKTLKQEAILLMNSAPDLVEWRVDLFQQIEDLETVMFALSEIRATIKDTPLLFTFRSVKEGGEKSITTDYYYRLYQEILLTGQIDIIDIELSKKEETIRTLIEKAHQAGVSVILSSHDFQRTPTKRTIITKLKKMQLLGCDISKIAVMAQSEEDALTLLEATNTMRKSYADRPFITISMGSKGRIARLCGGLFGSAITFAAGKEASAPGQIGAEELRLVLMLLHDDNLPIK